MRVGRSRSSARALALALAGLAVLTALSSCTTAEVKTKRLSAGAEAEGGGATVARVGALRIPASLVAESAAARGLEPRHALSSLVDDAVAASEGLKQGVDHRADVRRALDAALARQVTRRLRDSAIAQGPVTDEELHSLTALRWQEVDLPERRVVVHAVVLRPKEPKNVPVEKDRAPHVADAIRAAVQSIMPHPNAVAAFEKEAKAVPTSGFEVKVERLPPFARDGRVAERGSDSRMNATFAEATFALGEGETSPVVETPFGWHVIRVLQRLPEDRLPADQRRQLFFEEAVARRARRAYETLIEDLKKRHPPNVETYAAAALASLPLPSSTAQPASSISTSPPLPAATESKVHRP